MDQNATDSYVSLPQLNEMDQNNIPLVMKIIFYTIMHMILVGNIRIWSGAIIGGIFN